MVRVVFGIWLVRELSVLSGSSFVEALFLGGCEILSIDVRNVVALNMNLVATETEIETGQRLARSTKGIVQYMVILLLWLLVIFTSFCL